MNTRKSILALAAVSLVTAVPLLQGCSQQQAPPDPRTSEQKTEAEWFNKKAVEVGGDFDKLSPEDRQRAIRFTKGNESYARTGMAMAGKNLKK